jgi:hypothetical protein
MKSSDFKNIPKKFEMGTIIDEGEDFCIIIFIFYYRIKSSKKNKS